MLDPNRNRKQLPPPVTTRPVAPTFAQSPIAPRTAQGTPNPVQRVDLNLPDALKAAPPITGYRQSNVNANRSGAGLVAPPLPPPNPPPQSRGGQPGGGLVPAAQAAEPDATRLAAPPLAKPASFTDPAGNLRSFADPKSAASAREALESPGGQEKLRGEMLNRTFDPTKGPGTAAELAFAAPGLAAPGPAQQVSLAAPAIGTASPPPNLPLAKGEEGGGPGAADGVDVIRGTSVQRAGGAGTGGGGSPVDIYRDALAANLQAGLEHGADIRQYAPEIKFLSEAEKNRAREAKLPTLSQFQAQRAQELIRDPGAINPADELVFPNRGATAAPKVNTRKLFDNPNDPGFQTGQLDYVLDADGKYREVTVERAAAPGAPTAARPSLGQFLTKARLDPRNAGVSDEDLTKHYRKTYVR